MDIKAYFDTIDHALLMKAVRKHTGQKWVLLYIERWLKAPVIHPDGREEARTVGHPARRGDQSTAGESVSALRI